MALRHPFERIGEGRLRLVAVPLVALVAVILGLFPWILPARETETLIDLVEAGTPRDAAYLLAHWSEADKVRAAHAVGLDYVLNPAYASFAALACIWASRVLRGVGAAASRLGVAIAWIAWATILSNVVENVALYRMLLGSFASPWPELARLAHFYAGAALFGAALPYVLAACVVRAVGGRGRDPS